MTSIFPSMHQAPDGHVLLRTLIGGRTDPEVLALSDEELVEAVRAPLATLLGLEGAPALAHVVRWPEAIPQYEVGHQQHVETITARCEALGLHPTGSALFGVGVNDVIRHAAVVAAQLCTP
jgi:oxygen-dependent protoporphyrinogen oxidase